MRYSTVPEDSFGHGQTMSEPQRRAAYLLLERVLTWEHHYAPVGDWQAGGGMDDRELELADLVTKAAAGIKRGNEMIAAIVDAHQGQTWDDATIRKVELLCLGLSVCQQSLEITMREMAKTGLVVMGDPTVLDTSRVLVDGAVE